MRQTYALNVYENWSGFRAAEERGEGPQWKNADPQRKRLIDQILREKKARGDAS